MRKLLFFAAITVVFVACQPSLKQIEDKTPEFVTRYYVNKEGKKEGLQTKTDAVSGAVVQEAMFHNGLQEGKETFFFSSGKVQEVRNYKADKQDGLAQTFYENEVLRSEVNFVNGAMQGQYKKYYENKQLKESVTMVDNVENGAFKEFYANGKPKAEGTYTFNTALEVELETGPLTLYDSLGVVTHKLCENGKCVEVK